MSTLDCRDIENDIALSRGGPMDVRICLDLRILIRLHNFYLPLLWFPFCNTCSYMCCSSLSIHVGSNATMECSDNRDSFRVVKAAKADTSVEFALSARKGPSRWPTFP